jgi:hypothetical protein
LTRLQDSFARTGLDLSFLKNGAWARQFDAVLIIAIILWSIAIAPLLVPGLNSDRGIFVSVGERLLAGDRLYSGVYDNKEPLFYYFVAAQLALGPWAQVSAEVILIAIAAGAAYIVAAQTGTRWPAAVISFVAVPLTLTGAFYHPGYTELPGIALAMAAVAASCRERPFLAGLCIGLLAFTKLIFTPVALLSAVCFPLWRRRVFDVSTIALGALMSATLVTGVLALRGELLPFIETIKLNIDYAQRALIGSQGGLMALVAHIKWIWSAASCQIAMISLATALILIGLSRNSGVSPVAIGAAAACISAFLGSLLVLSLTGLWKHHLQILYVPSIIAAAGLTPFIHSAAARSRLSALGLAVLIGYLLGGISEPGEYVRRYAQSLGSYAELTELSPEAQRLLQTGDAGIYSRFGTNDDQGHARGLRSWRLACPRFHQYYFEPAALLNRVFDCASATPTLIISRDFGPGPPQPWDAFAERVENLIRSSYSCDADAGLRICRRHVSPDGYYGGPNRAALQ